MGNTVHDLSANLQFSEQVTKAKLLVGGGATHHLGNYARYLFAGYGSRYNIKDSEEVKLPPIGSALPDYWTKI
jgi:hypothetical protein